MNWATVSLASVCEKPQYGAIAKGTTRPVGPRFIRQTDIASGRIDWSSVPFCDLPHGELVKFAVRRGDVLISRLGNGVGNVAVVRDTKDAVFAGYLVRFRARQSVADSEFIGYQLQSSAWKQHVSGFQSGAAQPTLNAQQMGEYCFKIPPLKEQRAIAATLSALDDKLESNRQVRQLTGELLQTLFKSWFVTFERWGGNAPANWREGRLGDVLFSVKNATKPGSEISRPYVPIDMMPTKSIGLEDFRPNDEAQSSLLLFEKNDILIGAMRIYFHRVSLAPFAGITRTTSFVLRPFDGTYLDFALLLCNEESTITYAEGTSKGSTMPYAVWENGLAGLPTLIPPPDVARDFSQMVRPLVERIRDDLFETRTLIRIRDTLLPELMTGRIRVPAAGEVVA